MKTRLIEQAKKALYNANVFYDAGNYFQALRYYGEVNAITAILEDEFDIYLDECEEYNQLDDAIWETYELIKHIICEVK